jgi:cytochrome c biogenesis protein CcmG, thiol:disulfide interchange protein DsbE
MALPLALFAALATLFWLRLGSGDPSHIPSALIDHPAPQTTLPPVERAFSAIASRSLG